MHANEKFLNNNNISSKIIDVDLLGIGEKKAIFKFIQPMNPNLIFPTLIVGDLAIIGEDYDGAKEVLNL